MYWVRLKRKQKEIEAARLSRIELGEQSISGNFKSSKLYWQLHWQQFEKYCEIYYKVYN